jgi:hypothetical protein
MEIARHGPARKGAGIGRRTRHLRNRLRAAAKRGRFFLRALLLQWMGGCTDDEERRGTHPPALSKIVAAAEP